MKRYETKTRRLILRPLQFSDYKTWAKAQKDSESPKNTWDHGGRKEAERTQQKFREILNKQKEDRARDYFYHIAAFEKKSGELVGSVSAMQVTRLVSHSAFLGYGVMNRHWGKGYGKEMVEGMFTIAFGPLKLHRLEAGVEPNNRRSIMLARSLKLRKEGLKKRALFLREQWVDLVIYSITCEELGIKWKAPVIRPTR